MRKRKKEREREKKTRVIREFSGEKVMEELSTLNQDNAASANHNVVEKNAETRDRWQEIVYDIIASRNFILKPYRQAAELVWCKVFF